MPHVPLSPEEYAERLLGRFTSILGANTAAQNSGVATFFGNVAEELALADRRFGELVQAFHFKGIAGQRLRDRLDQLPKDFPRPYDASRASGGDFTVRRSESTASERVFPAGSIRAHLYGDPTKVYANTDELTMGVGVSELTSVSFTAAVAGEAGSAGKGQVSAVESSPDSVISYVKNFAALVGTNAESEDEAIRRAQRWLWAQAQCQRNAVQILAENYRSDIDPTRILYARVWSDPDHLGYSEVYLENGTAMQGFTRPAVAHTGVIPDNLPSGRRYRLTFDYPAASSPTLRITKAVSPFSVMERTVQSGAWTQVEEQGLLRIKTNPAQYGLDIEAGDTWETFGHTVYTGLTVELQMYLERFCTALGTRIRARHGRPQAVTISANVVITPYSGRTYAQIKEDVRQAIVFYVYRIPPGEPLILYKLKQVLGRIRGLNNIIFDHGDLYAGGDFWKLVTSTGLVFLR